MTSPERIRRGVHSRSQPWRVQRYWALHRLGYDSYASYLASTHWAELRQAWLRSGRVYQCICGQSADALHHETYVRLGREELDDLVPLCRYCHTMIHVLDERGVSGLSVARLRNLRQAWLYERQYEEMRQRRVDDLDRLSAWRKTLAGELWCEIRDDFQLRLTNHCRGHLPETANDRAAIGRQLQRMEQRLIRGVERSRPFTPQRLYDTVLGLGVVLHEKLPQRHPKEAALWVLAAENRVLGIDSTRKTRLDCGNRPVTDHSLRVRAKAATG